ncbi:hypothetical protein IJ380_01880 [Candidatus Saccharibacteria bacterium]|nr:hypothetical protein [Candidatus Saccharibacteria bacterium]
MPNKPKAGVYIAPGRKPWPHERRAADILALAGYYVEFLPEGSLHTADVIVDGIEYEMKSPKSATANSLEHLLKKALKQSPNIIIDASRLKGIREDKICKFLASQARSRKQIKKLLLVTKAGKIIDIFGLL